MTFEPVTAEAVFVARCCREGIDQDQIEGLAPSVRDWKRVVELSGQHRVALLLLPRFDALDRNGRVPPEIVESLRSAAARSVSTICGPVPPPFWIVVVP